MLILSMDDKASCHGSNYLVLSDMSLSACILYPNVFVFKSLKSLYCIAITCTHADNIMVDSFKYVMYILIPNLYNCSPKVTIWLLFFCSNVPTAKIIPSFKDIMRRKVRCSLWSTTKAIYFD